MDDSIERATYLKVSKEKIFYLYNSTQKLKVPHPVNYYNSTQKLKVPHPVNYFPGFLGRNIKNCLGTLCPPSKFFLFTSMECVLLFFEFRVKIFEFRDKFSSFESRFLNFESRFLSFESKFLEFRAKFLSFEPSF